MGSNEYMILHLGVLDVSYSDASGGGETTTGDVAEILEKNYGVMETFYELRKEKIADFLADSMAQSIEMLVKSGRRIDTGERSSFASHKLAGMRKKRRVESDQSGSLTYGADQKIKQEFRAFIFSNEMGRLYQAFSGAALSAAAAAGKTKRTKSGYTKGRKERPAFVDTGLYVSSFRAWTSET